MKIYFESPEFDSQLLRALSYTYYQGADIGECLMTASRIKAKDFDSWYDEWTATADRVYTIGEESLGSGCSISAKQAFLRASNYYRTSMFFLYGAPVDPRLRTAYTKHRQSFGQAIALFSTQVSTVAIPYENTTLPGYFYNASPSGEKLPVVIISNGYDGTHQECYLNGGAAALERGYHVLCFDGPGQGKLLIEDNIPMRYDWENVITPAVDYLMSRADVDFGRIVLVGPSWGGYLAPRAAAFEHRISALVANPGQYDVLENLRKAIPDVNELLENDPEQLLNKNLGPILSNPMLAAKFRAKMWIHGTDSPIELLRIWKNYTLADVACKIQCPTLIMDSENEPLGSGQAKKLYDALNCPKDYILFNAKDGAGEHCEAGAGSFANQRLYDWLSKISAAALKG